MKILVWYLFHLELLQEGPIRLEIPLSFLVEILRAIAGSGFRRTVLITAVIVNLLTARRPRLQHIPRVRSYGKAMRIISSIQFRFFLCLSKCIGAWRNSIISFLRFSPTKSLAQNLKSTFLTGTHKMSLYSSPCFCWL